MNLKLQPKSVNVDALSQMDAIAAIETYCEQKGYSKPVYKYLRVTESHKIQCRVTVNQITYSTYPNEFSTELEAKLDAATYAFQQIKETEIKEQFPVCMDSTKEMAIKILECINKNGVFKREIPRMFQ